jgi:deazaflavin-dependent oxidoreductase (nitroreductase family)
MDTMSDDDPMTSEREFNRRNIAEFRANDGRVGGQFEGFPLLIMTSTGAKSGEPRENLIGYFDIDDTIYVVGSAAGRDASPAWVFNLRADPTVTVEIGPNPPTQMVARELPKADRGNVYARIVELAPGFGEYEKRTDRVIPVFSLSPSA